MEVITLPKGKELVQLMMKWEIVNKEEIGGKIQNYIKAQCSNCDYQREKILKGGWNNYANHYTTCVGINNLAELVARKRLTNDTTRSLVQYNPQSQSNKIIHVTL